MLRKIFIPVFLLFGSLGLCAQQQQFHASENYEQLQRLRRLYPYPVQQWDSLRCAWYGECHAANHPMRALHSLSCPLAKRAFGWYTPGAGTNFQWNLLSDLSYVSYDVDASTGNAENSTQISNWQNDVGVLAAQQNGVSVNLCVQLLDGSDVNTFLSSSTAQTQLITNVIAAVQAANAKGVNIDFEGTTLGTTFVTFMSDLSTQLHSAIPGSELSMDIQGSLSGSTSLFTQLNPSVDLFILMGYDYFWAGQDLPGPVAPLYNFYSSSYGNVSNDINNCLLAINPAKLVLAVPYYGRQWVTTSGCNLPATGSGPALHSYEYIATLTDAYNYFSNPSRDSYTFCPYYCFTDHSGNPDEGFYDDVYSYQKKCDVIYERGLAGMGMWQLGFDGDSLELWNLINSNLTSCATIPCTDTLYDMGGPYGNYHQNESYTFTIAPPGANSVALTFYSFDLVNGYDSLYVYDGASTSSTLLGGFTGNTLPPILTAASGKMTIHFNSVAQGSPGTGYMAVYVCNQGTNTCVPVTINVTAVDETSLNADNGSAAVAATTGLVPFTYIWSNNATVDSINGLSPGSYTVTVTGNDGCSNTGSVTVGTLGTQPPTCSGTTTYTATSATFDDGSGNGYYTNNLHCSWLIQPNAVITSITLCFNSFDLAAGDTLKIYNGSSTAAPLLKVDAGTQLPICVTSTGGSLFLQFTTNATDTALGWMVNYYCNYPSSSAGITNYEYWFDNDYTDKIGIAILPQTEFDLNAALTSPSVTSGQHTFHIRFQQADGQWSSVISQIVSVTPQPQDGANRDIVYYEYWLDANYAANTRIYTGAQPEVVANSSLALPVVASGIHSLNLRFIDNAGYYSSVISQLIDILPSVPPSDTITITEYDYWFDNNYNTLQRVPVSNQPSYALLSNLNSSSLAMGVHTLQLRFLESNGLYSSVINSTFFKIGNNFLNPNLITTYRYWFDTLASGMTTVLTQTTVNPYDLITNINASALAMGQHVVNFQFKDLGDQWSSVITDTFITNNTPAPVAAFLANDTVICHPGTVTFANLSTGSTSYQWYFGDGGTSTGTNPSHTFSSEGLYSVTLVASNGQNVHDTLTKQNYIRVDVPSISVSPNTSVCPGDTVTLTASGNVSYAWNPSTDLSATNSPNVEAFPNSNTTYNVIGTDLYGCTDTGTVMVSISAHVSVGISPNTVTMCSGDSVQLTASGASGYSWYPGGGLSATNVTSVFAHPTITTTYYVIGTASCGIDTGSITITVNQTPIANASNDTSVCAGSQVNLTATGGGTYQWSNGVNTAADNVTPANTTVYRVTVTANSCIATDSVIITINPVPQISLHDTTICTGTTVILNAGNPGATYLWEDGSTNQSYTVTGAGTYSVIVTNGSGCSATDTAIVTVGALQVHLSDTSACQGHSVVLNAGYAGSTYLWSNNATTQQINVTATGLYSVTVTHSVGCTGSAAATVTIYPPPNASAGNNVTICNGESIALTANGGATYYWSNGVNTVADTVKPSVTTTYYVTVTDNHTCTASDSVIVLVNPLPTVIISPFSLVTDSASAFALSGGSPVGGTYSGVGVSNGTFHPAIAGVGTHIITYTYTDSLGCTDSAQANIVVTNFTGTQNITDGPTIQLYPNPTSSLINLVIGNVNGAIITVQITNALGQKIDNEQYNPGNYFTTKYDLGALASGLYYFKVSIGEKAQMFGITVAK